MTLVQEAIHFPGASPLLAKAGRQEETALILGSVLPDLPYHARFIQQAFRHLTHQEYLLSEWGDIFHTRSTGRFALAMLRHIIRSHMNPEQKQKNLAFLAGYLCHHAVDRVVHPVIKMLVDRELERTPSVHHNVIHSRIERYQSLLYHKDQLGEDILCTPFPRRLVGKMAGVGLFRPRLDDILWKAFRSICLEIHGRAPSIKEVSNWLWGITAYGHLISSPLGRLEQLEDEEKKIRKKYFQGPDVDLKTPLKVGVEATTDAWQAATAVLTSERITSEVQEVFLQRVPDVDLSTGA